MLVSKDCQSSLIYFCAVLIHAASTVSDIREDIEKIDVVFNSLKCYFKI